MAKTISNLSVGLFGDISPFAGAFGGGAVKTIESFVGTIGSAGGSLIAFAGVGTVIAAAVGGIGAAIGAAFAVKDQFAAIDATAKLADRLGVTTEAYTGLEHAASIAGVSSEQLTGGFEKMFKTLGEAMAGGDKAQQTFASLGLNFMQLQSESPEAAFKEIAQRISQIQNPAQRAAAAMDVFGKSGQELIPLLAKGAAGIEAAQAEAVKLGITFSRIDAGKVEAANEAVTRLKSVFVGVARTITIALAPLVTFGADRITAGLSVIVPAVNHVVTGISAAVADLYGRVMPYVDATVNGVTVVWGMIEPFIAGELSTLWGSVQAVWGGIYSYLSGVAGEIYDAVSSRWDDVLEVVTEVGLGIWNAVTTYWIAIFSIAAELWQDVVAIWQWGTNLIFGETADVCDGTSSAFGGMVDAAVDFGQGIATALQIAEYAYSHLGDVVDLVGAGLALFVVTTGNQISYAFTDVIPAILVWFSDNWQDIFTDIFNYTSTVLINLTANIINVISSIPGLISGETDWSDVWAPLTDGFESSLKEMPAIAERQKGDLETALEQNVADLSQKMGDGLAEHIANRQQQAADAAKKISAGLKAAFQMPTAKAPVLADPKPLKTSLDNSSLTVTIKPELAGAIKAGSAEAQALAFAVRPQLISPQPPPVSAPPTAAPPPWESPESSTEASGKKDKERRQLDFLDRIEKNTRQNDLQIAEFA